MRASTSWVSTSAGIADKLLIKPSKAAVETDPGTAPHRDCGPCAGPTLTAVIKQAQPDHPGLGRLLPDSGIQRGLPARSIPTCGGSPTSGLSSATANKPTSWIIARYFGMFNKSRRDRWVFGDRQSGAYMHKFAWTRIVRHRMVKGTASPDDPALADYWAERRRKTHPCRSARPAWDS